MGQTTMTELPLAAAPGGSAGTRQHRVLAVEQRRRLLGLEPHEPRLRLQGDTETIPHLGAHLGGKGQHLRSGGTAAIDDGQTVAGGQADPAADRALGQARPLDEPGGCERVPCV